MKTDPKVKPKKTSKTRTKSIPAADSKFVWTRKHLLGLEGLSKEELLHIFHTAEQFQQVSQRSIKKVPALRGRVVANLFFEGSTRTRTSFTLAAQRLSADILNFTEAGSSISKGESLRDTVKNIEAMGIHITYQDAPIAT
jgi:aspartate carbamoyltransferase catalytic subunit